MKKNKEPETYYRISVLGLHFKGKKLLLTKGADGYWRIPGGGPNHGESIQQCLIREIREELGVGIKKISKLPLAVIPTHHRGAYRILLIYKIQLASLKFRWSEENTDANFFSKDELSKLRTFPSIKMLPEIL